MGKIVAKQQDKNEQYKFVDNEKVRLSLVALSDKYSESIRDHILNIYNNPKLHDAYRAIRNSGLYQKGGKSKVHRKIVEFPDAYVFDFVDTVMNALYGEEWLYDSRAMRHELVKPWLVVKKI